MCVVGDFGYFRITPAGFNKVELTSIFIANRGNGKGSFVMDMLTRIQDDMFKHGAHITLVLTTCDYFDVNFSYFKHYFGFDVCAKYNLPTTTQVTNTKNYVLAKFYSKFGFNEIKVRKSNKNLSDCIDMSRQPKIK
jgi:hypothetical protein